MRNPESRIAWQVITCAWHVTSKMARESLAWHLPGMPGETPGEIVERVLHQVAIARVAIKKKKKKKKRIQGSNVKHKK